MIYGIGTDIVAIKRIEDSLTKFGDRFVQRILSAAEITEYAGERQPVRFLAKRFAVKEAFSKAFGTGIGAEVSLHDVAVAHDAMGKPMIAASPELVKRLAASGVSAMHVSISDEAEYAIAYVVLEKSSNKSSNKP